MRGGVNGRELVARVGWDAVIRRVDAHVGGVAWRLGGGRQEHTSERDSVVEVVGQGLFEDEGTDAKRLQPF